MLGPGLVIIRLLSLHLRGMCHIRGSVVRRELGYLLPVRRQLRLVVISRVRRRLLVQVGGGPVARRGLVLVLWAAAAAPVAA